MNHFLLMAPPAGGAGAGGQFQGIIMIVLLIVVFYFFMIRPQMTKAKKEKQFREGIKKGDKVVTIGGIHGKIVELQDRTFTLEVEGESVRLRIEKAAINVELTAASNQPAETPGLAKK